MLFDLFRISAIDRPLDLFDDPEMVRPTKEDWIRKIFSTPLEFRGRSAMLHYAPALDNTVIKSVDDNGSWLMTGRIGRTKREKENQPPDQGLEEFERDAWHAFRIIIDPRKHDDGQKIAAERDQTVAQPNAAFQAFANHINDFCQPQPYILKIRTIPDKDSFWEFAKKNKCITSVTFDVLAPNMFGIHDDFDKDRSDLKKNENSDRTTIQLNSNDGLNVNTVLVSKLVEWVLLGTGTMKARAKNKKRYDSNQKVKKEIIDDIDDDVSWDDLRKKLVQRIFDI